jgi:hypothetical protein
MCKAVISFDRLDSERLTIRCSSEDGGVYRRAVAGDNIQRESKIRRTIKRPFVIDLGEKLKRMEGWIDGKGRPLYRRHWYNAVGCKVFDGLCINQADFNEIDCAQCIKSTFESLINGCRHREVYVDQYGTIRCVDCKDELGQMEDSDVFEDDDPGEISDPMERDDADSISNHPLCRNYRSWNLEGRGSQAAPEEK